MLDPPAIIKDDAHIEVVVSDKHVALTLTSMIVVIGVQTHQVWFTSADLDLARYVYQLKVERGKQGVSEGGRKEGRDWESKGGKDGGRE